MIGELEAGMKNVTKQESKMNINNKKIITLFFCLSLAFVFVGEVNALASACYDSTGDSPNNPQRGGRPEETGIQSYIDVDSAIEADPTDDEPNKPREPIIRWRVNEDLPSGISANLPCRYWIQISRDGAFDSIVYDTGEVISDDTSHRVDWDALERETDHYLRVAVRDEYGWTPWPKGTKIHVPGLAPDPPVSISAELDSYKNCGESNNITFSWDFVDPDGDSQGAYRLQVDSSSGFNNPEYDSLKQSTSQESTTISFDNYFNYETTYHARLKTWNASYDFDSEWSDIATFTKNCHTTSWKEGSFEVDVERATPGFEYDPPEPHPDETVHFSDDSEPGFYPIIGWQWTFKGADPNEGSGPETSTEFKGDEDEWEATLEVEDQEGVICPVTESLEIGTDLPDWEETDPFN